MSQQQQVQLTIDEANKQIARGEALGRLLNNPDFAEIVGEVYYKEEPARLSGLLGDIAGSYRFCPTSQALTLPPEQFVQMRESIEKDLHAVGAFQSFLRVVAWRAERAQEALDELEAMENEPVVGESDDGFEEA